MSTAVARYVVDADVGVKLVLPEPFSDRSAVLFDLLGGDAPNVLCVPDLFYAECANVLWKHARRGRVAIDAATRGAEILRGLNLTVMGTAELMRSALDLALKHDISAYDACYFALAEQLGVSLITADKRLVRKLAGASQQIQWLGTWSA
ncbi:MAG: hypothetical protein AMXMBFR13_49880 [Phycisphaerae bacterium]